MASYSKLLPYTCYELGHTWNPSCAKSSLDMLLSSASHSLKLYSIVYLVMVLFSREKLSKSYALNVLKNYLQSVCFLSINGSAYVGSFCVLRYLFGHINFLSASFIPGFISSLLAILAERRSRRSLLAIYVINVASECLWNVLKDRGYVRSVYKGEVMLFALSMTFLGYFFKSKTRFSPAINSFLKFAIGKEESGEFGEETHSPEYNNALKVDSKKHSVQRSKSSRFSRHILCPHKKSCMIHLLKTFAKNFIAGYAFQVGIKVFTSLKKVAGKPSILLEICQHSSALQLALFVSSFVTLFKAVCCITRHVTNEEKPSNGAVAGAVSGLSMLFYSSPSVALYLLWKTVEAGYEKGEKAGYLPHIPGSVEFLYAFATAYLFHVAAMENFNMKPSYWKFLMNLTNGRFAEYNRTLLEPYGLSSGRKQLWPRYDEKYITPEFKAKFAEKMRG